MPTMRQLAQLAGVSVGTVSLALRDHPRISTATRQRIQALAREYGYLPNRLGQAFISGHSRLLGCLMHRHVGPVYTRILQGVMEQANAEEYRVLVVQTRQSDADITVAVRSLLEHRVEGIVLAVVLNRPLPREVLLEIQSHDIIPVAVRDTAFSIPTDAVMSDEDAVVNLAISYLRGMGHAAIAFLGWDSTGSPKMVDTFRHTLAHYGLPTRYCALARRPEAAYTALATWMRAPTRPTAIVTFDVYAELLRFHALSSGLRVPQDLSILGLGNMFGDMFYPSLTTIEEHADSMGREAVSLIMRRLAMRASETAYQPETVRIAPSLIERTTCAPPAFLPPS